MLLPIVGCVARHSRRRARLIDLTVEVLRRIDDMQHDVEVQVVKLADDRFRIGKNSLVENKRAVPGVPAGRTKPGAEIDQGVAG